MESGRVGNGRVAASGQGGPNDYGERASQGTLAHTRSNARPRGSAAPSTRADMLAGFALRSSRAAARSVAPLVITSSTSNTRRSRTAAAAESGRRAVGGARNRGADG